MAGEATEVMTLDGPPIATLSYDCLFEIMVRLDRSPRSLVAASMADRRFHEAANHPLLWRRQAERRMGARTVRYVCHAMSQHLASGGPSFETGVWKRCVALFPHIRVDIEVHQTEVIYWDHSPYGTTMPYRTVRRSTVSLSQVRTWRALEEQCRGRTDKHHVWLVARKERFPDATCSARVRAYQADDHGYQLGCEENIIPLRLLSDKRGAPCKPWCRDIEKEALVKCVMTQGAIGFPTVYVEVLVVDFDGNGSCEPIPACVEKALDVPIDLSDPLTQRGTWYALGDTRVRAVAHADGCACPQSQ